MNVYNYVSGTSNTVSQIVPVPLKFGISDKAYLFNLQQQSGKRYYPKIPSMQMSFDGLSYNSDRATSVNEIRNFYDPTLNVSVAEEFWEDVIPTPYDYNYTLELYTESWDHLFQLIEQINPYFNPTNHIRLKEFDFLNLERDLRVELTNTSIDQQANLAEDESRYFSAKLSFKVDAYLYRPIDFGKIIKYIKTNYIYDGFNSEIYSTSAIPTSATPPISYNWDFILSTSATGYVKVSE